MRVLVVEDDPRLASVLRQGLKEQGYGVDLAADATQGFDMAMAGNTSSAGIITVVIMLIFGGAGLKVARHLRSQS